MIVGIHTCQRTEGPYLSHLLLMYSLSTSYPLRMLLLLLLLLLLLEQTAASAP